MAEIVVRDLDDAVVEKLRTRAKAAGRPLEAEAKAALEESVNSVRARRMDKATASKLLREFRARFGDRTFSDSVELIREDRDNR